MKPLDRFSELMLLTAKVALIIFITILLILFGIMLVRRIIGSIKNRRKKNEMSKFKRIFLTIFIALLGIGFEVLNYYVFVLNYKWYKIGITTAGLYIVFISIAGNIVVNHYLENKKGERK